MLGDDGRGTGHLFFDIFSSCIMACCAGSFCMGDSELPHEHHLQRHATAAFLPYRQDTSLLSISSFLFTTAYRPFYSDSVCCRLLYSNFS